MDPANTDNTNSIPDVQSDQSASPPPPIPAFQTISDQPLDTSLPQDPVSTSTVLAQDSFGGSSDSAPLVNTPPNNSAKKKVLASFAVLLMLFGIGAGVFVIRNRQFSESFAWDCSLYTFTLDDNGTISVLNGSKRDEPGQQARVYINDSLVETYDVPALNSGEGATLGTVSLPTNQSYTWKIEGTKDCMNTGSKGTLIPTSVCNQVLAYDEEWNQLTANELTQLVEGDIVRFTVSATATSGTFEKARFSVNGEAPIEVTDKRPGSDEYYYEYTIPADVINFDVSAEVFHNELGWF